MLYPPGQKIVHTRFRILARPAKLFTATSKIRPAAAKSTVFSSSFAVPSVPRGIWREGNFRSRPPFRPALWSASVVLAHVFSTKIGARRCPLLVAGGQQPRSPWIRPVASWGVSLRADPAAPATIEQPAFNLQWNQG